MESVRSARRARRLAGAALVVALALGAAACGGSGSSDTTTTAGANATVAWASAVCTSFSAWKASLQRDRASVASEPSQTQFQNAAHQAVLATQGLESSLQQLGKPPTATSAKVQQSISTLRTQLESGKDKINATLNGSNPTPAERRSNIVTVRTTANSMLDSFTTTVDDLQSLDPGSELSKAFHQATACDPFFT
jgi:small-conductance mechanosensitive channel